MIGGLALKYLLGKRLTLVFTSASQRRQTWLTRWLIRQMDAVVATSEKSASYLQVPAQVIMHGIDLRNKLRYVPVVFRKRPHSFYGTCATWAMFVIAHS